MIVLGVNMLGNLNKEAVSQDSLGLAFWRIVISSGILVFILGWLNLVSVRQIRVQNLADSADANIMFRATFSATAVVASQPVKSVPTAPSPCTRLPCHRARTARPLLPSWRSPTSRTPSRRRNRAATRFASSHPSAATPSFLHTTPAHPLRRRTRRTATQLRSRQPANTLARPTAPKRRSGDSGSPADKVWVRSSR